MLGEHGCFRERLLRDRGEPMWRDKVLFIESIRRLLEFRAPGNLFLRKAFSSREGNLWN